jgi:hypothetical protein
LQNGIGAGSVHRIAGMDASLTWSGGARILTLTNFNHSWVKVFQQTNRFLYLFNWKGRNHKFEVLAGASLPLTPVFGVPFRPMYLVRVVVSGYAYFEKNMTSPQIWMGWWSRIG